MLIESLIEDGIFGYIFFANQTLNILSAGLQRTIESNNRNNISYLLKFQLQPLE